MIDKRILMREEAESCIGCGLCTKNCLFLEKYKINLKDFSERLELLYSCFLCDKCREVCPKDISGKRIALLGRRAEAEDRGDKAPSGYGGLLWEKDPYKFANYRGAKKSVLWTGCNFKAFFPKTEKRLREIFAKYGIGVIYDCCGKPVDELGLYKDADKNISAVAEKLANLGVNELIMVCPNCYYYMRGKLPENIRLVTVYEKLSELSEGRKISAVGRLPFYIPCPDRAERIFFRDISAFLIKEGEGASDNISNSDNTLNSDNTSNADTCVAETDTYKKIQCCGLGGCAAAKEPELSAQMTKEALAAAKDKELYTYCASCVSRFKRQGFSGARHVLPLILDVCEELPGGIKPFINRAMSLF